MTTTVVPTRSRTLVQGRGPIGAPAARVAVGSLRLFTRAMAEIRTPFWRLVLSYILLLMVPVCAVFVLYSARFFADYRRSLEADSDRNLRNLSAFVDAEMARLWSTVAHASADTVLSPALSFDDIPALRRAQTTLSSYRAGQSYILDIGIYLPTIHRLLTARTIVSSQDLPFSVDDLPESLRRGSGGAALFSSASNAFLMPMEASLVLVAFPFPVDALSSDSFLLVVLNRDAMRRTIEQYFPGKGFSVRIDGPTGMVAASIGNAAGMPTVPWDGEASSHRHTVAPTASLFRYTSVVSRDLILQPLRGLQRSFLLLVLGTLLFGFAGMYALTAINYRPIRNLRRLIETRLHAHSDEHDEILAIERAVEEYSDGFDRLQQTSSEAALDGLVTRLVLGQVRSVEDANGTAMPEGSRLVEGSFQAIVFALESAAVPDRSRIDEALEELRTTDNRLFLKVDAREANSQLVVVLNDPKPIDGVWLARALRTTQVLFAGLAGAAPSVGVGEACCAPDQAGRSYIQAMACIDYTLVKGRGEIVFFGELASHPQGGGFSLAGPIKDLSLSIRECDGSAVDRIMAEIVDTMKARRYPLFVARCACFDLINAVIHTARDCGLSVSDSPDDPPFRGLERFRTIDDLSSIVKDLSNAVQQVLQGAHRHSELSVQARAQIRQHFAEPGFYIQRLCASLNASPSYLSQVFKQAYGTTISEYMSRLRIEEAQKLLLGTDLAVDQIIRRVGYSDRSSFSKKFRAWVGTSPGDYRKRSRREPSSAPPA